MKNNYWKNGKTNQIRQLFNKDEEFEDILEDVDKIVLRVDNIGEELDINMQLTNNVSDGVNKLDRDMVQVKNSLKKSLNKMRDPNKLCMDIFMFSILALLVGVLIWSIKFYSNLV